MPKKLTIGSFGSEVVQLQNFLNLLPSFLPRLLADGNFGNKTKTRTVEFQRNSSLVPDGVVGPVTWAALLEIVARLLPPGSIPPGSIPPAELPPSVDPTLIKRLEVIRIARTEAERNGINLLAAKNAGRKDPANDYAYRLGYENLIKYFRVAAPKPGTGTSFYDEDHIAYLINPGQLAPMKHWCGIFVLWVFKTAGLPVGNWIDARGLADVSGIKGVNDKRGEIRGCVGYVDQPHQHHFIIEEVFTDKFVKKVKTIDGNSFPSSNFNANGIKNLNDIKVYSPYQ